MFSQFDWLCSMLCYTLVPGNKHFGISALHMSMILQGGETQKVELGAEWVLVSLPSLSYLRLIISLWEYTWPIPNLI